MATGLNLSFGKSGKRKSFNFLITNLPNDLTGEKFYEHLERDAGDLDIVQIKMDYSDEVTNKARARLFFDNEESYQIAKKKVFKLDIEGTKIFVVEKREDPSIPDRKPASYMKALTPQIQKFIQRLGFGSSQVEGEQGAIGGGESSRVEAGSSNVQHGSPENVPEVEEKKKIFTIGFGKDDEEDDYADFAYYWDYK